MLDVFVSTKAQFEALSKELPIHRIYLDYSLLTEKDLLSTSCEEWKGKLFLAGPYVIREHNRKDLKTIEEAMRSGRFHGLLFRNLETYAYMKKVLPESRLIPDHNLYFWNHETVQFWEKRVTEYTLPVEQNQAEWKELLAKAPVDMKAAVIVYGRLPMMITANCIENTLKKAAGMKRASAFLQTVIRLHFRCCITAGAVIISSITVCRYPFMPLLRRTCAAFRLTALTLQRKNGEEVEIVVRYFADLLSGVDVKPPYQEYTTGHIKRGVE